jgi:hypothetical protein
LVKFPWNDGGDEQRPAFKPLGNDAGFLLDIEGRKVVALKLPGNVAREVVGQASVTDGVLAKLARLWRRVEPKQWLVVANMQNGSLNDPETFASLVAEGLSKASGVTVPASELVIAGSNRAAKTEKQAELAITT